MIDATISISGLLAIITLFILLNLIILYVSNLLLFWLDTSKIITILFVTVFMIGSIVLISGIFNPGFRVGEPISYSVILFFFSCGTLVGLLVLKERLLKKIGGTDILLFRTRYIALTVIVTIILASYVMSVPVISIEDPEFKSDSSMVSVNETDHVIVNSYEYDLIEVYNKNKLSGSIITKKYQDTYPLNDYCLQECTLRLVDYEETTSVTINDHGETVKAKFNNKIKEETIYYSYNKPKDNLIFFNEGVDVELVLE